MISASGRCFRSNALAAVMEQLKRRPQPIKVNVEVSVLLFPPDKRQRDFDNYFEVLFDSLTYAGMWLDDVQIKKLTVESKEKIKYGKAEVTIQLHKVTDDKCQL